MTSPVIGEKATPREWIGLAVLALACVVYAMDLTVLMLAVPHLTQDLQPTASQLLWITDIYGFLIAGLLITMGTLGDRIGRRKLLMIGSAAFAVGSAIAACAHTAEALIAARALLGVAGATLAPSTLSLIRNMFLDEHQRTFAIGIWIASFSAGGALGPLIGGAMLEHFWWGSVFLIALPVMALLLALGPFMLPESKDPNAGRLELFSALLSLVAVLSVIYGLKKFAEYGFDWLYVVIVLFGLGVGYLFVRRQLKLKDPLIDVKLFTVPGFSAALSINIIGLFMAFGFFLLSAQYLQLVIGLSPLMAGIWSAPTGIAFIVGSMVAPSIIKRVRRVYILVGGFILSAIGMLLIAQIDSMGPLWLFIGGSVIFCLGLAPIATVTTDMVMTIAPAERAGAASAMSETSFEFGGAVGIAVIGSMVMAYYRVMMADQLPPGMDESAMDTLGAAVVIAQGLSPIEGGPMLSAARDIFTQGLVAVAYISALLSLLAAGLAYALLRQFRVRAEGD